MLDRAGGRLWGQNLRRARQLLEDARTGGVMLTEESLDELLSLIGELEEAEEN